MSSATVNAAANLSETYVPSINPELKHFLVQLHATAFVFAWFFLVVVSSASARYLRQLMPNYKPFGLLVWFHIHRTLNIIALVFILIGLCTVFVAYEWTWKGPRFNSSKNWSPGAIHTAFGTAAAIMAFGQPLNAFFRCSPTHPKRRFYNVFHRTLGVATVSLGIASRFFQKRFISTTASFALYVLELLVLVGFVFAVEYWMDRTKRQKRMSENGKIVNRRSPDVPRFYCIAVGMLAGITACISTLICILVWLK
ncbi:Cytochrome b561 domain-containing protein [Aphelenchoides besseyi]|nr:Cytochrome b561 domain-containing protein [Aphelenchoides besseyi]KAI6207581.1 Cytochrome b561 domain-containing protein [Aphelenchoides besseyi]